MKMVRLTQHNDQPLWVNPNQVVSLEEEGDVGLCTISVGGRGACYVIRGTPAEVAHLLLKEGS